MDTRTLEWNWRGQTIRLGADASGSGPKVLLLPALSSISSRREMHPLQERLAPRYSTLAVDWPGFGEAARPQIEQQLRKNQPQHTYPQNNQKLRTIFHPSDHALLRR